MIKPSLWPRSLRLQMILFILGTVILVQLGSFAVGNYLKERFLEDVVVNYLSTTIRTLRSAVSQIPENRRAEFIIEASQKRWYLLSRTDPYANRRHRGGTLDAPVPSPRPPVPEAAREVERARRAAAQKPPRPPRLTDEPSNDILKIVRRLNIELDDGTRVGLTRGPTPRMFISLQSDDDGTKFIREWLVIPLDRIQPPNMHAITIAWLSLTGLLLILAAGFAWHITRPLTRLTLAADKLAQGRPERVTPAGPNETRQLGERFNAMLDALEESKAVQQTLLAGLPHDLKSPLARMRLRVELTDDVTFKEGMRNDVHEMQDMIDQFISYVRGSDLATYKFKTIDIGHWIEERVASWHNAGSPVHLRAQPATAAYTSADTLSLGRVLDNLISNALKHGRPPVEVSLTVADDKAVISVADHGDGIPAERRAEALRAFSRLDSARTMTGSVGLGLSLAETIVNAHNGRLRLDSSDSGGLLVTVTLPLVSPSAS
ncbi:ATPase [Advenella sp. S44]|nr:ATPase [Advenella sp. S44]